MNRLNRRIRQAASRGCYVIQRRSWPIYTENLNQWDVYVESECMLGPRDLKLSKRQAVALAYAIGVSKRLVITVDMSGP